MRAPFGALFLYYFSFKCNEKGVDVGYGKGFLSLKKTGKT